MGGQTESLKHAKAGVTKRVVFFPWNSSTCIIILGTFS